MTNIMKSKKLSFKHKIYSSTADLPAEIQKLVNRASKQTKYAYAPYSQFFVGAAILMENGKIIGGCNQENVSYPLCICAERVALYTYGAKTIKSKIKAMAVTAKYDLKELKEPCMPCGACRQVIQEYENRQSQPIDIYSTAEGVDQIVYFKGIETILPTAFSQSTLL